MTKQGLEGRMKDFLIVIVAYDSGIADFAERKIMIKEGQIVT